MPGAPPHPTQPGPQSSPRRGRYTVRACLRDGGSWRGENAIAFLTGLGPAVEIVEGCDLFVEGSYDAAFEGVTAVFHVAAVLGNSSNNQPLGAGNVDDDTYNGGVAGTRNVLGSVEKSSTVQRVIYTSSLSAMNNSTGHWHESGYEWTEEDWASDVSSSRTTRTPGLTPPRPVGLSGHEVLPGRPGRLVQHHHRL